MKVIALRGQINSGKSHTLNIVYQFLLRDGYIQVPGFFEVLGNPKFEDVLDILEKGGKRVGICGMGDYTIGAGSLKALLARLGSQGCHVAVCSCQSKPRIIKAVTDYPDHDFVDKTPSSGSENHRIVNGIDAESMYRLV
jgi:hypothetical protein